MLRALRSEVGGDADLEAVLSASGGDVNTAAAPWRGRAATIGLLQERLRAAQAAAGQVGRSAYMRGQAVRSPYRIAEYWFAPLQPEPYWPTSKHSLLMLQPAGIGLMIYVQQCIWISNNKHVEYYRGAGVVQLCRASLLKDEFLCCCQYATI